MRKKIADGGFETPYRLPEADRGTRVRTDQTDKGLPAVLVAERRKSARRMGNDLHRPQPHKARKSRMRRLLSQNRNVKGAIWTGS